MGWHATVSIPASATKFSYSCRQCAGTREWPEPRSHFGFPGMSHVLDMNGRHIQTCRGSRRNLCLGSLGSVTSLCDAMDYCKGVALLAERTRR